MTDDTKDRTTYTVRGGEAITRARVRELRDLIAARYREPGVHARAVPAPQNAIGLTGPEVETVLAALGVLLALPERRKSDEVDAAYRASVLAAAPPAGPPRSVVNVRALLAALLERIPLPELGRVIENIAGGDVERLGQKIEIATWCHDGVRACLDEMATRLLGGAST